MGPVRFTMADRMTSSSAPPEAEQTPNEARATAPKVLVLLTTVEGADLDAAVAAVRRQVYDPAPEIWIVGEAEEREEVSVVPNLEAAISRADQTVEYLWILHADARPRPDALAALVREVERNEAALGGSKLLVAGTPDVLESVGSATDVFGEPYSGLEEGEIDLQQYDVVREVAFVRSASMLVRRDLAQGLRGLDERLPPIAAGLDFSQRSRLAGGKVISVPSSEVYHQGKCDEGAEGWKERAGRLRAMLTAYTPLTLLWVVPYDFIVAILDSIGNLLLGRWRPAARHAAAWAWNVAMLPSTIRLRARNRKIRVAGDEELFRFQARGSVRLREVGSELSSRVLGLLDEDQALTRGARRVWSAPGIWGAVVAGLIALIAARSILLTGMPSTDGTLPFEAARTSFARWFGGWNDSGLGSPGSVHPSVLITGVLSIVTFGATEAARTLFTLAAAVIGIVGMGRLGGRLGLRGPGRYMAGLVLLAGPGTSLLTGDGSWVALGAAALLPWVMRAVLVPEDWSGPGTFGWVLVLAVPMAAFSPLLAAVPLVLAVFLSPRGLLRRRLLRGLVALGGVVVAVPFLVADPGWVTDSARRILAVPAIEWAAMIIVGSAATLLMEGRWRGVALVGGIAALAAAVALHLPGFGPGVEEALLIAASFGAALVVAAGLDVFTAEPLRIVATATTVAMIVVSLGSFGNGRLGLPDGDHFERYGFGIALSGETDPGRILLVSADRSVLPGDARPGPGFWYRLIDASGMTHDEVWLPAPRDGDRALRDTLEHIAAGGELRPGALLAEFAIDWVVVQGPEIGLEQALVGQLDLLPTPFDTGDRIYENLASAEIAGAGDVAWARAGAGYAGDEVNGRVRLAINHAEGWGPDGQPDGWAVTVDGRDGQAHYRGPATAAALASIGPVAFLAGLALIAWGRRKKR